MNVKVKGLKQRSCVQNEKWTTVSVSKCKKITLGTLWDMKIYIKFFQYFVSVLRTANKGEKRRE
jgi:hypothetical protein